MHKRTFTLAVAAVIFGAPVTHADDQYELADAALNASAAAAGEAIRAEWVDETLFVYGTERDDSIAVSAYDGEIEVNAGLVPIEGAVATVADTQLIVLHGFGGNDHLKLEPWGGALPTGAIFGSGSEPGGARGVLSIRAWRRRT